jgi:hypothetical protein
MSGRAAECRDPRPMEGTPLQLAPIWDSGWGKYNATRVCALVSGMSAVRPIADVLRLKPGRHLPSFCDQPVSGR